MELARREREEVVASFLASSLSLHNETHLAPPATRGKEKKKNLLTMFAGVQKKKKSAASVALSLPRCVVRVFQSIKLHQIIPTAAARRTCSSIIYLFIFFPPESIRVYQTYPSDKKKFQLLALENRECKTTGTQ